jgi:hypothetical protein
MATSGGVLTRDDQEAQEIAQETRHYFLHTGIHQYAPDRGRLLPFIKASARWMALRYYRKREQRGEVELLLSQLRARHPDIDTDAELADILAYARGGASPSAEAIALDAEYERLQAEVHDELFQITFTHGTSPPHYLVALGFRLWPDPVPEGSGTRTPPRKPSPVWPPRRIVAELSDTALTTLAAQLEDGLVHAATYLSEARIRALMSDLRQHMEQNVHAICMQLQREPRQSDRPDLPPWCVAVALHHGSGVGLTEDLDDQQRSAIMDILRRCRVGITTFRHYYTTPKPEDDIGHWCAEVQRQVWRAIRKQGKGHLFGRL